MSRQITVVCACSKMTANIDVRVDLVCTVCVQISACSCGFRGFPMSPRCSRAAAARCADAAIRNSKRKCECSNAFPQKISQPHSHSRKQHTRHEHDSRAVHEITSTLIASPSPHNLRAGTVQNRFGRSRSESRAPGSRALESVVVVVVCAGAEAEGMMMMTAGCSRWRCVTGDRSLSLSRSRSLSLSL
jgi:hypothetical protein